jgi:hypothetical protein
VADVDAAKYDDAYFKSAEKKAAKQSEEGFFAEQTEKTPLPAEYVANQKAVDAALLGKLRCVRVCGRGWVVGRCWRQSCAAAGLMAAVEGGSMKMKMKIAAGGVGAAVRAVACERQVSCLFSVGLLRLEQRLLPCMLPIGYSTAAD